MAPQVPKSDDHLRAHQWIPGGVNSAQRQTSANLTWIVASTQGATFTTTSGQEFIDFHAAFGPPLLGHNDPDVDAAVVASLERLGPAGIGATGPEVALAELLVTHIPSAEKVLLTTSGSAATFHAIRMARAATGRPKIVKFQGCYHGWHDSVAMNVASPESALGGIDLISDGIHPALAKDTLVVPFNSLDATDVAFEQNPDEIAAVIVEPIAHNVGAILPQPGFLEGLRDLTRRNNAALIFDEVITGFRHHVGGMQAVFGVVPDLTALGKSIGNGYPIAAVCGSAGLMDMFSTNPSGSVLFAGTFNGHPAMSSAAVATIRKLVDEAVHERLFALGERVRTELADIYAAHAPRHTIAGYGSVFVAYLMDGPIQSYADLLRNDDARFVEIRMRQLEHGVFEIPRNLKRSHISNAHTNEHIEKLLEAADKALSSVFR